MTVLARWKVAADEVSTVLSLVAALRKDTLAEVGCLAYDVFRGVEAPGEILLIERYLDAAAVDAHRATPHYQDLVVRRIMPLLSERNVEFLAAAPPG
ncbi:MAG TPA: putative quinol monooxygenase [Ideonella sp.]|nr:putative quinol monooxygenase [Ideonella sp.]